MLVFANTRRSWVKYTRFIAAAALAAGSAVALTPSSAMAADKGTNCTGDVSMGHSTTRITNDISIKVNGITYGNSKVGLYNYVKDGRPYHLVAFAVADTRSDGKAPYIRAYETTVGGSTSGGDFRVISRRGAAGGWVCYNYLAEYRVTKISLKGSVADTPSVPEPTIVTINY
jgi:hypothetical protein